ncbi:MAG: sn-glycerol-1-phosphate dehydrogenase [Clostridia bacterium]|nr:sn-glycerol-1-phosphate dehydrogenase [Clostridia bacterium]
MEISELLKGVNCSCGKTHCCAIKYVFIENNATKHLKDICADYNRILIVADENTYGVAGAKTEEYISEKIADRQIFGKEILIPNEDAIDAVKAKLNNIDLIIGIGSGVIQDLCKYVSHFEHVPYFVVATAPSMDGYASSGAAMITGGMKVTYSAKVPDAFIADTSILKDAPIEMIKAGYGDIIGKFSALNDWKLGQIVNGEYFCQYIYDLTYDMLKKTLPLAESLLARDEESIKVLTEALIVVGIAMSFAENSRPASGSEHHLSHFFEITGIVNGKEYLPHGIDVAFSTIETAKIRQKLANVPFPKKPFVMDRTDYEAKMKEVYSTVAEGCIALQDKLGTYKSDRHSVYLEKENEIKAILREAPTSEEITEILSRVGLDRKQFTDTYTNKQIKDAISFAKDLKDRYSVLWMYFDMFGTEEI